MFWRQLLFGCFPQVLEADGHDIDEGILVEGGKKRSSMKFGKQEYSLISYDFGYEGVSLDKDRLRWSDWSVMKCEVVKASLYFSNQKRLT